MDFVLEEALEAILEIIVMSGLLAFVLYLFLNVDKFY